MQTSRNVLLHFITCMITNDNDNISLFSQVLPNEYD